MIGSTVFVVLIFGSIALIILGLHRLNEAEKKVRKWCSKTFD